MWQNVLRFDTMSSEESGEEEGEEVIYVKHIPWRCKRFKDFVTRLDTQSTSHKSAMANHRSLLCNIQKFAMQYTYHIIYSILHLDKAISFTFSRKFEH